MSLKLEPIGPIPQETARVAKALPAGQYHYEDARSAGSAF